MTDQRILDGILAKLGLARIGAARPTAGQPANKRKAGPGRNVREFEDRLHSILKQHQNNAENRVFLIDLDGCRQKYGAKWQGAQERVHQIVHGIMDARLAKDDMFIRRDDTSYVVTFATLSRKEAQIKCTLIGQEIRRRLVGHEEVDEPVDIKTVAVGENGHVQYKDLPSVESLLKEIVNDFDQPAAEEDDDPDRGVIRASATDGVQFVFRPMLAVRTKMISTFMCIPILALKGRLCVSGYGVLGEHSKPSHILDLDLLSLGKVAFELTRLDERGEKSLVSMSVHFETLADSRLRSRYLQRCAEGIGRNNDRIVFEIVGLPEGIPQVRLVDLVSCLRPHGRAVIARFPPSHRNFTGFRTSGLHAVGIDIYDSLEREDVLMRQMDDFAHAANRNRLKTYVSGVRSISLYTAAVAAGYDYAAGHALTSISDAAEGAYVYRMETPYLSALEGDGGQGRPTYEDRDDDILSSPSQ